MGLPNVFLKNKKNNNELFISLLLTDISVSSALWKIVEGQVHILNQSSVRYYQSEDDQLIQCDESLQDLGKESEKTDQVLFALEPEWATQTEIKVPHDERLQELCKSLSLEAVGFVLSTEALINHLTSDNHYLSALVVYLGSTSLTLNVLHQGQIQKTLSVGRSENILLDIQEVLARLNGDLEKSGKKFPLNMVLASASVEDENLSLYQQQLLSIDWVSEYGFIQQPVVEVVKSKEVLEAVVKQGGVAVAKDSGLITKEVDMSFESEDDELIDEEQTELMSDSLAVPGSANITSPVKETAVATSFGVPIAVDQVGPKSNDQSGALASKENQPRISKKKKPSKKQKIKLIIAVAVILGLLVSALVSFVLLKSSYQVAIAIQPSVHRLDKELNILLDSSISKSDPELNLLKAEKITKEMSGDESTLTTGVKQVGEKATGEIRILNKTDSDKTFDKGTVVYAGSLEFVLDEEVKVPASKVEVSSTGDSEKREYGQKNVKVVAKEIGTESNVSKDTDFKIESFSTETYSAKAVENFTGGSSREIRVVSESDYQELLTTLRQKLLKKARDEMLESQKIDLHIVPTEEFKIISQEYNAEIGDEANEVSLSLKIEVNGLTYTNQDLLDLARVVLADDVPQNYEFVDNGLKVDSKLIESEEEGNSQLRIEAKLEGKAQAKVDTESLINDLPNLQIDEVNSKLTQLEEVDEVEFEFTPSFAGSLFKKMPSNIEKIKLDVKQ